MTTESTEPTQPAQPTQSFDSVQAILDVLRPYEGVYRREAVEAAIVRREEITPHLLEILDEVLADPESHVDEMGHTYALFLLGQFRTPEAHEKVVALFSLPDPPLDSLFGDTITEDLPILLLYTCNGSVDRIKKMILDPAVYEFSRASAVQALTYAVLEGYVTRDETVEFLSGLFTGDETDDPDSIFWPEIVNALSDLHPAESMAVIEDAYERELVGDWLINIDRVRADCSLSQEETLARLRDRMERQSYDDVHQAMAWWVSFKETEQKTAAGTPLALPAPSTLSSSTPGPARKPKSSKIVGAKKKKKRKTAKAARKKQRRKKK